MTPTPQQPSSAADTAADENAMDVARQTTVALSAAIAVLGAVLGSGALVGTPIDEAADGVLAADATLVAPAGPAFSIWTVIYLGLVALAALQALPSRRTDPRQRRTGWLIAASLLLNAAWILCIQAGWVTGTVPVIVLLLAVLVLTFGRTLSTRPASRLEAVIVDGTLGLYLGWVTVATLANIAAALVAAGVDATGTAATVWAVTVLAVAGAVGLLLAFTSGGRLAPAAALAWGLVWILVGRTNGEPESWPAAVAAALAAAVTVLAAVVARLQVAGRRRSTPPTSRGGAS